ncbi:hypothetical protein [Pseudooceanicola sp.]|nr:hypothetical protein [Pseudooceanicola sp.]MDF1854434.1 hypothetical protein [Pseudooceanicola sp.]
MRTKQKRWMKSVIEASKADYAPLPFHRGTRKSLNVRRDAATPKAA